MYGYWRDVARSAPVKIFWPSSRCTKKAIDDIGSCAAMFISAINQNAVKIIYIIY